VKKFVIATISAISLFADGSIELATIYIKSSNNLDGDSHRYIKNLNSSPKSYSEILVAPIFRLNYKNYFIGTDIGTNAPMLEFGLNFSNFYTSILYSNLEDVFENPYLNYRTPTNLNRVGAKAGFKDKKFGVEYKLIYEDVEKDLVQKELKRDGFIHSLKLNYNSLYGRDIFIRELNFDISDYDGVAQNYTKGEIGFGWLKNINNFSILIKGSLIYKYYSQSHPIFNKNSEAKGSNIIFISTINQIFSQNDFIKIGLFYNNLNSNIDFYDTQKAFSLISIGYKF